MMVNEATYLRPLLVDSSKRPVPKMSKYCKRKSGKEVDEEIVGRSNSLLQIGRLQEHVRFRNAQFMLNQ